MITRSKVKGFTLVELMLGMFLGLIVISGVTYIYVSVVTSTSDTLKSSKLNTQLMMVMSIISDEVRRAGYWDNPGALPASQNPFNEVDDTLLTIFTKSGVKVLEDTNSDGSCILFAYDADQEGDLDIASGNSEYFGFKFDQNSGSILMAINTGENKANSCTASAWELLTDNSLIKITNLAFNPGASSCVNSSEPDMVDNDGDGTEDELKERDCYTVTPTIGHVTVETREILISIEGELINDPAVKSTIQQSVRVRNDVVRIR